MTYPGTPTLNQIAEQEIKNFSDAELFSYTKNYKNVLDNLSNNDWLMPFICQYDQRNTVSFAESIWYINIKCMIQTNNLFMALIKTDSWAYPDQNQKENFQLLENAGFVVEKHNGNTDGIFTTPDCGIKISQLYMTDELTPPLTEIPRKDFIGSGYIEFGTQSISKTAYYLQYNQPLIRLPYDPQIPNLSPFAALFVNYRQLETIDF
jgi:hypothetical protein